MADEQDRTKALETEPIFEQTLQDSQKDNYLGHYSVINALLRVSLADVLKQNLTPENIAGIVKIQAKKLAKILLGQDSNYVGMHHWNESGHIDKFCATWLGSEETDPEDVMEHTVVMFFGEALALIKYIETNGVLPEQWQFQVDAIVTKYVYTFLGVDNPLQAVLNLGTEEAGTLDENE